MENVFAEIVAKLGSQRALADLCDASPQRVWKWKSSGRIPPEQVRKIEAATGIPAERIRPDIFAPHTA